MGRTGKFEVPGDEAGPSLVNAGGAAASWQGGAAVDSKLLGVAQRILKFNIVRTMGGPTATTPRWQHRRLFNVEIGLQLIQRSSEIWFTQSLTSLWGPQPRLAVHLWTAVPPSCPIMCAKPPRPVLLPQTTTLAVHVSHHAAFGQELSFDI